MSGAAQRSCVRKPFSRKSLQDSSSLLCHDLCCHADVQGKCSVGPLKTQSSWPDTLVIGYLLSHRNSMPLQPPAPAVEFCTQEANRSDECRRRMSCRSLLAAASHESSGIVPSCSGPGMGLWASTYYPLHLPMVAVGRAIEGSADEWLALVW